MIVSHKVCHIALAAMYVALALLTVLGESAVLLHAAAEVLLGAIYLLIARLGHGGGGSEGRPSG